MIVLVSLKTRSTHFFMRLYTYAQCAMDHYKVVHVYISIWPWDQNLEVCIVVDAGCKMCNIIFNLQFQYEK